MIMRSTAAVAVLAAGLFGAGSAAAETITYDFNSGLPAGFSQFNTGNLFSVDTTSAVRLFKGADPGTVNANGFIGAGVTAPVSLAGDFTVTVDFTNLNLPNVSGSKLNEALLTASGGSSAGSVFRLNGNNVQFVSLFTEDGAFGLAGNASTSGQLRLQRIGDELFGYIANSIGGPFVLVASDDTGLDPFLVTLQVAQGANAGARSTSAIDVTFDNLVITADDIVGFNDTPVPEPAALLLLGAGLAGLGLFRRRR